MRICKITIEFYRQETIYSFALSCGRTMKMNEGMRPADAYWYVGIEYVTDEDPRSASIHQYELACKPTRKQMSRMKKQSKLEHIAEWERDKKFIEVYNRGEIV